MEDDKKLQEEFIQFLAQQLNAKTEQDLTQKVKKLGKEGVKKYYDAFVQYKQKQAKKAAHGTKLTYFKHLKNQCPEGEEVVYYKVGGRVGCGCQKVKKAEEGTEVNPIDNFKKIVNKVKNSVTTQIPKQKPKQKSNDIILKKEDLNQGDYAGDVDHNGFLKTKAFGRVNVNKLTKNQMKKLTPGERESVNVYMSDEHIPSNEKGSKIKKNCGGVKLVKKGEKVCPKCGKVHSAGMGCAVAQFKKHYQGGSLNHIPFMQKAGIIKKPRTLSHTVQWGGDKINEEITQRPAQYYNNGQLAIPQQSDTIYTHLNTGQKVSNLDRTPLKKKLYNTLKRRYKDYISLNNAKYNIK